MTPMQGRGAEVFLLGDEELKEVAGCYRIYAARIFVEFFPALNFLADLVPKHIPRG